MIPMEQLKTEVDDILKVMSALSHDDLPGLGKVLNALESLESGLQGDGFDDVLGVSTLLRKYIEAIVLGEPLDFEPIREGLVLMKAMIRHLAEEFADGEVDYLDGITAQFDDWWFNVRMSNTEPLLRLVLEARTADLMEEKKTVLLGYLGTPE